MIKSRGEGVLNISWKETPTYFTHANGAVGTRTAKHANGEEKIYIY